MNEVSVLHIRVVKCYGNTWGFAFQAASRWVASANEVLLKSESGQSADQGYVITLYFLISVEDDK